MERSQTAPATLPEQYVIDDVILDTGRRRASRRGADLELSKLSFDLLLLLAEQAPNAVSHAELAERVWGPRRVVTPETLSQSLLRLRHALGDCVSRPRYIESVRGYGYRLIPPVGNTPEQNAGARRPNAAPAQRPGTPAFDYKVVTGCVAGALVALLFIAYRLTIADIPLAESARQVTRDNGRLPNSIAVLPFESPGTDPNTDDARFANTVHAGVLNQLGQLDALNVIAQASVLYYAKTDLPIPAVADALNVRLVLKGGIYYFGDERCIIVELVAGDSGIQLWTKRYVATTPNALPFQREIAADVAAELTFLFGMQDDLRILGPPTTSDEAWALFWRADRELNEDRGRYALSSQLLLDRAIRLDPEFSYAYGLKALLYAYELEDAIAPEDDPSVVLAERRRLLHENATKALEINPDNDIAYWALGLENMFGWNWSTARPYFEKTLEISPHHSTFLAQFGWFRVCLLGEREGMTHIRRAAELDPRNPFVPEAKGQSLNCLGDREGAYAALRRAVEMEPIGYRRRVLRARYAPGATDRESALYELRTMEPLGERRWGAMAHFAHGYAALGEYDDTRRLGERLLSLSEVNRISPPLLVYAHLAVGNREAALANLEQAVENLGHGSNFWALLDIKVNQGPHVPALEEPEFAGLRAKLRSFD